MGWRLEKTRRELGEFYAEIVRDNGPRYRNPSEWGHLWVDLWVSLFSMSYTLGHIAAFAVPLYVVWRILA
jgi:hypothetical protein